LLWIDAVGYSKIYNILKCIIKGQGDFMGDQHSGYLAGHLLIAMPAMTDQRFERAVIYLCAHNEDGAMGLIINQSLNSITFEELMNQLNISVTKFDDPSIHIERPEIHYGGPVEIGRGFVLHTPDYHHQGTIDMDDDICLTTSADILHDIARGNEPAQYVLALGYAGWEAGQLDQEIQENAWLCVPANQKLVFDPDLSAKWEQAMASIGVDVSLLSGDAGHA
jgi:putative transcriptional regulator